MLDFKILVCTHKTDRCIRKDDIYMPIHVGKALTNSSLGFMGDNTGDNISAKNKMYCELTAMYWAWKNFDVKYIGLAHYRRYFDCDVSLSTIEHLLAKKDIILINPVIHPHSLDVEFERMVSFEDLYILLDILLKRHPDYKQAVLSYIFYSNKWIPFNMFISTKIFFDAYCKFLFPLLFEVETKIKMSGYSRLNRTLGYMGELLLGVYCMHMHANIKYVPCCQPEVLQSSLFWRFQNSLRNHLAFLFCKRIKHLQNIPLYNSVVTGLKNDGIDIGYLLGNSQIE